MSGDHCIAMTGAKECYWYLIGRGPGMLLNFLRDSRHNRELSGPNVNSAIIEKPKDVRDPC